MKPGQSLPLNNLNMIRNFRAIRGSSANGKLKAHYWEDSVLSPLLMIGEGPNPRLQLSTQCSFVFAASDTTKTCTLGSEYWNSELHGYIITIPTFSATNPTATFTIYNPAGQVIYGPISGLAEGTTHPYTPTSRPLTFGSSYVILLTTTAGTGGGTCTIDSWVYK
jgi:hypothetical protein